ncbi:PEP/pyruvate-binding domain-containing protein [Thalassomonas sp. RHCl1]|uniref:PEP/pyruvate-binding domain-containing protein n=1 Tax=Thalassomonas sp. RHCl1 TaxID=2995320 RepID=UPI00248D2F07|nr:PEP/pyruvate-binding domain-containing protein [Thalassomonas sp. RHCl1]
MSANTPAKIQGEYTYSFKELIDNSKLHLVENLDEQQQVFAKMSAAGLLVEGTPGFVISTRLFHDFIEKNELDEAIKQLVLEYSYGVETLSSAATAIRALIGKGQFTQTQNQVITSAYQHLMAELGQPELVVKSFVPESGREAYGFVAHQECELTAICPQTLLQACIECFAALYNDAAILYREEQGISCPQVVICVSAAD